jgi:hypothetical protein
VRRFLIQLLALLILPGALAAQTRETGDPPLSVTNRERTLRFSLLFDGESVSYRVDRLNPDGAENVVIDRSPLGIARGMQDFRRGFELVSASPVTELSGMYRMATGKQSEIRTRARQRVFTFRKGTAGLMTITVRAMRDGVAFRYGFPVAGAPDSLIGESTGFHLPAGRAWLQPYGGVKSAYLNGIATGTPSPEGGGWALPMLFRTSDSWVLVAETGNDRTSYGVHVQQRADDGVYRLRPLTAAASNGGSPAITLPWVSPWRVLIIGSTLGTLVESTLATDLAQPLATSPSLLAVQAGHQSGDTALQNWTAIEHTIDPFTRNVVEPVANEPDIFGGGRSHPTTNPHELALSVVLESGVRPVSSLPDSVDAQPAYVRQFLSAVPTAWDETRFVDGYPGRLAVLARRRGTDWYVGAITSDTMVSVAEVPLRFLGAGTYDAALISDGEDVDRFAYATERLIRRDTMTVELAPRGGFVARFTRRGAPGPDVPLRPDAEAPSAAAGPTARPRRAP